ncbi:[protein-PII] uridylyltransferase [Ponticaulis profundi]|uniref:Bifunctional uridylyltransferase/uridylyl-removing enzyme n=1 Tax=Ponticaulis profundi TaxID=2665222 RepID=A0ABW1S9V6_9PROT
MTDLAPATSEDPTSKPAKRAKLKPWNIESVMDTRKLRVQLQAAAMDHMQDQKAMRSRAMDLMHGALFRGRMIAQERLNEGADGLDTARLLAAVQNEVISTLFDFTTNYVFGERNLTSGERLAVLAVGGYGRNVLAPSSDIDLLFLRNYKETPWAESVIEYMLYMLWDMGLKVGHAFRTVDECIRLAKEDLNTETALLDARYLAGDESIAKNLFDRYHSDLVQGRASQFIAAKLNERDKRHKKQGDTRYVVEPNVKEGKGGLRDLQTLFWLVRHTYGGDTLEDILSHREVFTEEEARIFRKAGMFLWAVRCHIHYLTGRPEERLSFDLQPEIAKRMGFEDEGSRLGVERFMKQYFLETKAVGALTRILCAKLEADQQKSKAGGLLDFFGLKNELRIDQPGFKVVSGRLSIEDQAFFFLNPVEMLRLFVLAEKHQIDIHPYALSAVTRSRSYFSSKHRESPEAREMFLHLLLDTKDPGPVLRMMNEADLLGQMVPEFGEIVSQTQFNMYHHFTVDEHTLQAVEAIAEMERGDKCDIFPLGCELFPQIKHKRALYLAMLLHDTGKGLGDQQVEGAITAKRASRRLGLDEAEADLIAWLVGNHLEMSDCAQKRDISDPRTISQFAERVGTLERLQLLLILTVADIRAVGPDVWNGWKGQLLRELYTATAAALESDHVKEQEVAVDLDQRAAETRNALVARKGDLPPRLQQMDSAYWTSQPDVQLDWHVDELRDAQGEMVVTCRVSPDSGAVELFIAAKDREKLFADIVGAITDEGATIATAQIFTGKAGGVIDLFVLQDDEGRAFAFGEKSRLDRLSAKVADAIEKGHVPTKLAKPFRAGREAVFVVDPDIIFDNQGSADYTILEITGKERPGLLFDIANAIAKRDIRLNSAHAGAYGERIHDTFYVQSHDGTKLTDGDLTESLATDLLEILSRDSDLAPRTPARVLAQARSAESF